MRGIFAGVFFTAVALSPFGFAACSSSNPPEADAGREAGGEEDTSAPAQDATACLAKGEPCRGTGTLPCCKGLCTGPSSSSGELSGDGAGFVCSH